MRERDVWKRFLQKHAHSISQAPWIPPNREEVAKLRRTRWYCNLSGKDVIELSDLSAKDFTPDLSLS